MKEHLPAFEEMLSVERNVLNHSQHSHRLFQSEEFKNKYLLQIETATRNIAALEAVIKSIKG